MSDEDITAAPPRGYRLDPVVLERAARLLDLLRSRSQTLAVAESLTGGLVLATLTDIPGSSDVVRGGVVSYATDLKTGMLGVDAALLRSGGPVQAEVAAQMAGGVARLCGATWGLATTGVAGPGPADGHPAGTVHLAVASADARSHTPPITYLDPSLVDLAGQGADRTVIRAASVARVLRLALDTLS
ncbi:CinA family protein [Mobilicoccus sp.]|uniref:CinA family protein n=1 Tax=Mobilicoccus sp. TaxID=2034349 RepID=UPI0037C5157D